MKYSFWHGWYIPSNFEHSRQAEREILELGGIEVPAVLETDEIGSKMQLSDPVHLRHVEIGDGQSVNTLMIDKEGFNDWKDLEKASLNGKVQVVLCHGFAAGLGLFYKNYASLTSASRIRLYAMDWIGMGRSSRPPFLKLVQNNPEVAIDYFVDSLERWRVKQINLDRFVLVGHSLGGYLSVMYALKYPDRVSKLILLSPVGIPERQNPKQSIFGNNMPRWLRALWQCNFTPQSIVRAVGPFGPSLVETYTRAKYQHLGPKESQVLKHYIYHINAAPGSGEYALSAILYPGAWAKRPLIHKLKDLQVPTVFIYGEYDWMDYTNAFKAAPSMKYPPKIIQIPMSGHNMFLDNPPEFNRVLYNEIFD